MAVKKITSPEASAGAGTIFEYRVAAAFLAHLLRGSHAPGLLVPVDRVGLQQRVRGHLLDDVVVYGREDLCTEFQVKKIVKATAGDVAFIDVIEQALHVFERRGDVIEEGALSLGVVAGGPVGALAELEKLTEWAEAHGDHSTFLEVIQQPHVVDKKYRRRLEHVHDAVDVAIGRGAPDLGGAERTAHRLLRHLQLWRPALGERGADYLRALDDLRPVAEEFDTSAEALFLRLTEAAEAWAPRAGVDNAADVRRRLRRRGLRPKEQRADVTTPDSVDADAAVRGPMKAFGMEEDLERAEALLSAGIEQAVDAFGDLEQALRSQGFLPHANMMLRKRANALDAADRHDEAALARCRLAWDELDRVKVWEAGFVIHDGERQGARAPLSEVTMRAVRAVHAAVAFAKGSGSSFGRLTAGFDDAADDDPFLRRLAVFLCEEALAADQPSIVHERLPRMRTLSIRGGDDAADYTRDYELRLLMCIADVTDEWRDLLRDVHGRKPREAVAWARARYARYLALRGDSAGSQEAYLEAIERASVANRRDDAADWLYALRTVRSWYEEMPKDEQHPLAQAVRDRARYSDLPGSPHTAELALHAMVAEGTSHEALQRAARWRWQEFVRGGLTGELSAVRAMAAAHLRHDHVAEAVASYVRAGEVKQTKAAAVRLSEWSAGLGPELLRTVPDSRAAAFTAATAIIDIMPDDEVRRWADQALDQISSPGPRRRIGYSPHDQAFEFLAVAAPVLEDAAVDHVVTLIEPLGDHLHDKYRPTDRAVAKILTALAPTRQALVPLLCCAIVADSDMAEIIMDRIEDLSPFAATVFRELRSFAGQSEDACRAIILVGADPTPTLPLAWERVQKYLAPRDRQARTGNDYGSAAECATLASVLDEATRHHFAETALERAVDARESQYNRYDDLAAVHNIASHLDPDTAAKIRRGVMEISREQHNAGPADFYRDIPLTGLALRTAARLYPCRAEWSEIEQIATLHMQTADLAEASRIIGAIVRVPAEDSSLNLRQCAAHPSPGLRALAAIRWAHDPDALPHDQAFRLAKDPDHRVRADLADALASANRTPDQEAILAALANDARRSVRRLATAASGTHPTALSEHDVNDT